VVLWRSERTGLGMCEPCRAAHTTADAMNGRLTLTLPPSHARVMAAVFSSEATNEYGRTDRAKLMSAKHPSERFHGGRPTPKVWAILRCRLYPFTC
jgi:hypothetical protein